MANEGTNSIDVKPVYKVVVYKVVEAKDLQMWTEHGWSLVQVLPSTVQVNENPNSNLREYNSQGQPMPASFVPQFGQGSRFLLAYSGESAVADANKRVAAAEEKLFAHVVSSARLSQEAKTAIAAAEELKKKLDGKETELERWRSSLQQERARSQKMESDLGRVRKEIGEKEWTRINGGEGSR